MISVHGQVSDILIVGGSLAGLMAGLALSRHGLSVTLLERSNDTDRTGAALQVGYGLLEQLTGRRHAPATLATGIQAWQSVYRGLRIAAEEAGIQILQNARVELVGQDEGHVWALTSDNRRFEGSVMVGADGYQSVVRRQMCPERPDAVFAHYLAWVGFLDGAALRTDPVAALRSYEASRLPDVRTLGLSGQRISQDFVRAARRP